MLRLKRLSALLTAVCMLCVLALTAYAEPLLDLTKTGSIGVTMRYEGQAVPGGSLTLYQVGDVQNKDGSYSFVLTDEFAASGADLAGVGSADLDADLARALAAYAADHDLKGWTQQIAGDGTAEFREVKPGLYLLVQTEAAEGYNPASPFLVSMPMLEEGKYIYEVDAAPKVELTPISTPGPTPTPTPTPGIPFIPIIPIIPFWPTPTPVVTPTVPLEPAKPVISVDIEPAPEGPAATPRPAAPILPQTGQLNWPVPVLAAAGLGLFSVGWVLRYGKKDDDAQ